MTISLLATSARMLSIIAVVATMNMQGLLSQDSPTNETDMNLNPCENLKKGNGSVLLFGIQQDDNFYLMDNKGNGFDLPKQALTKNDTSGLWSLLIGLEHSILSKWTELKSSSVLSAKSVFMSNLNGFYYLVFSALSNDSRQNFLNISETPPVLSQQEIVSHPFPKFFLSSNDPDGYSYGVYESRESTNNHVARISWTFNEHKFSLSLDVKHRITEPKMGNCVSGVYLGNKTDSYQGLVFMVDNIARKVYSFNLTTSEAPKEISFEHFFVCEAISSFDGILLLGVIIGGILLCGCSILVCIKKSGSQLKSSLIKGSSGMWSFAGQATKTVTSGAKSTTNKAGQAAMKGVQVVGEAVGTAAISVKGAVVGRGSAKGTATSSTPNEESVSSTVTSSTTSVTSASSKGDK